MIARYWTITCIAVTSFGLFLAVSLKDMRKDDRLGSVNVRLHQ